ncbi:MAG: HU family DNA-binding protein [Acidimicrobiales bacterium]
MNKSELISAVAAHTAVSPKMVATVLNGTEDVVAARVKQGEKVIISGFVSFERVDRKARTARNPRTGEEIKVKASKAPRVAAGASLKKIVAGKAPAPKVSTNGARATKATAPARSAGTAKSAGRSAKKAAAPARGSRARSAR